MQEIFRSLLKFSSRFLYRCNSFIIPHFLKFVKRFFKTFFKVFCFASSYYTIRSVRFSIAFVCSGLSSFPLSLPSSLFFFQSAVFRHASRFFVSLSPDDYIIISHFFLFVNSFFPFFSSLEVLPIFYQVFVLFCPKHLRKPSCKADPARYCISDPDQIICLSKKGTPPQRNAPKNYS